MSRENFTYRLDKWNLIDHSYDLLDGLLLVWHVTCTQTDPLNRRISWANFTSFYIKIKLSKRIVIKIYEGKGLRFVTKSAREPSVRDFFE